MKSSDINSYLYDPKFTMSITVNGQLLLSILAENLVRLIDDCQVLQVNTDGITLRIRREDHLKYTEICSQWCEETKLQLEFTEYSKMVIQDVNNYMAITNKGKLKYKGLFEIEKEWHKDTSFKIVQIALSNYFIKSIPIETTIMNHKNIFDYCGRQKFRSDSYGEIRFIGKDEKDNFREYSQRQQKTTRYYISNKGASFIKVYPEKEKESFINKGYQTTIFNKYIKQEMNEYDINYQFYISEVTKILESVEDKQLTLF